jgi:hypothetical protein
MVTRGPNLLYLDDIAKESPLCSRIVHGKLEAGKMQHNDAVCITEFSEVCLNRIAEVLLHANDRRSSALMA